MTYQTPQALVGQANSGRRLRLGAALDQEALQVHVDLATSVETTWVRLAQEQCVHHRPLRWCRGHRCRTQSRHQAARDQRPARAGRHRIAVRKEQKKMTVCERRLERRARRRAVLLGVLIFVTSFLVGLCTSLIVQALW